MKTLWAFPKRPVQSPPVKRQVLINAEFEWTEARIEKLRGYWEDGLSTNQIARVMNISKNAVVGKAHRIGLPSRPSPIRRAADGAAPKARQRRATGDTLPPLKCLNGSNNLPPAAPVLIRNPASRSIPCCWPFGTPGKGDFRFCDVPSSPGRSYCSKHCGEAYLTPRDRRDDAVDRWA